MRLRMPPPTRRYAHGLTCIVVTALFRVSVAQSGGLDDRDTHLHPCFFLDADARIEERRSRDVSQSFPAVPHRK